MGILTLRNKYKEKGEMKLFLGFVKYSLLAVIFCEVVIFPFRCMRLRNYLIRSFVP